MIYVFTNDRPAFRDGMFVGSSIVVLAAAGEDEAKDYRQQQKQD
jgi:hypothetical protein